MQGECKELQAQQQSQCTMFTHFDLQTPRSMGKRLVQVPTLDKCPLGGQGVENGNTTTQLDPTCQRIMLQVTGVSRSFGVSGICLSMSDAHRCLARQGTRAGSHCLPDAANQDLRSLTSLCLHEPFCHGAGLLQRMG